jgi:hypothetical protein
MTPYLAALERAGTIAAARPGEAEPTSAAAPIARAPSSAPNLPTTIPLKRNVDVGQQPHRRLEPVGLLGAARSHSALESALVSRARVTTARMVNAAKFR